MVLLWIPVPLNVILEPPNSMMAYRHRRSCPARLSLRGFCAESIQARFHWPEKWTLIFATEKQMHVISLVLILVVQLASAVAPEMPKFVAQER